MATHSWPRAAHLLGCGGLLIAGSALSLSAQTMRPLPDPLYGLTLDDVSSMRDIVDALSSLPRMPIARVVFDEGTSPRSYRTAISAIQPHAYLMGEILDSEYVNTVSTSQYQNRTINFLNAFSSQVDLWEIGNEVNGEWLGRTSDVVAKISAAYTQVTNAGKRTALTLYYNPDCWSRQSNEMIPWASRNLPPTLRSGIDYLLVSYYEGDCNNHRPSSAEWTAVFTQLHQLFPNAKLGFGEVGMANAARSGTLAKAQDILRYYYGLRPAVPGWIGGGFWWYAAEDLVPKTKSLYATFTAAISGY